MIQIGRRESRNNYKKVVNVNKKRNAHETLWEEGCSLCVFVSCVERCSASVFDRTIHVSMLQAKQGGVGMA